MTAAPGANHSVQKAAAILLTFTGGEEEYRVQDVAKRTGLSGSTTSRLLATLESAQFVVRDPITNLYSLGSALITLGGAAVNKHPVHREARQRAQELAASTGLSVNVAVRRDASLFYLCNFEGKLAPKSFVLMGQRNPLHATGLGKCLLMACSAEERRELLQQMHQFTSHTIVSHAELDEVIEEARQRGYAVEVEELALGRACVAAPILNGGGDVAASISISGPLSALDLKNRQEELARAAIELADSISLQLGYVGPKMPSEQTSAPARQTAPLEEDN